ncbi:glutamate racemase [Brevibacillus sp. H7]|jgi:glutamate racemase|uniref:glutamate racemase n=1 Tax=Brevibacillus sp. H7 TaxID=3349138 RepID=UPI00380497A7
MSEQQAIAIIDSGVGGLTVAREVMRQLPNERILYFGDNARCPYGSKTPEEIRAYSFQMIDYVLQFPLKALVIACNTATAVVLGEARRRLHLPVIGVIEPGARAAVMASKTGRIGVIGTETTIRTRAYEHALLRLHPDLYVVGLACPAFVPLVERGMQRTDEARETVTKTLGQLRHEELDTLILGCTHYPLLAPVIQEVLGEDIRLISSAEETARELSSLLCSGQTEFPPALLHSPDHLFMTSGDQEKFREIAEEWLGRNLTVKRQVLEKSFQS